MESPTEMTTLERESQPPLLSTARCSDPDAVAGMLSGTRRKVLPLASDFRFFQAELRLEHLRLAIVKRSACISEGYLEPDEIGIGLAINESPGLKLDGVPLDHTTLMTHGLTTPHRIYQPSDLSIAALFLPTGNGDLGWPERANAARVHPVRPEGFAQLRSTVLDALRIAAVDKQRFACANVRTGVQQSLMGAIDHAFLTAPAVEIAGLATGNYVRICQRADAFIQAHGRQLPSSADVAAAAGATIRTLHNAMVAVRGMSLQRFMILNRLWGARAALLRATPGDRVKTVAFDHGFWHLGRFSRAYRDFFGEPPSQTVARARSRAV
jgi:AraC family ethanolamine operon transcriptional activator